MTANYVGVRYIGKKNTVIDSVNNTGAIWEGEGSVLNFTADLAKNLAVHTDSFELCDAEPEAKSYDGKSVVEKPKEDAFTVYLNVTKAQYESYARNELELILIPKNIKAELQAQMEKVNKADSEDKSTESESDVENNSTEDSETGQDDKSENDSGQISLADAVEELYQAKDKTALIRLMKQYGLSVSNNIQLDKLKERALIEIPQAIELAAA